MTYKQLSAVGLALCLLLLSARTVQGQPASTSCADTTDCAARFMEAQRLSKSGATEQALQHFKEIDRQYGDPTVLYPIAVMLDRLGRFAEAAVAYQRYLDSGAETDPARLAKVQEQLGQAQAKIPPPPPPPPIITIVKPPPDAPSSGGSIIPTQPSLKTEQQSVPVYKRGWFWAVVGGSVAVVAVGVGLGIGLGNQGPRLPDGVNTYNATF